MENNLLVRILRDAAPGLMKASGGGAWPWVHVELSALERTIKLVCGRAGVKAPCALVGRDTGQEIELTYMLRCADGVVYGVRTQLSRNAPRVPSLAAQWPALEYHERELTELLGIAFEGAAQGAFFARRVGGSAPAQDHGTPKTTKVEHRRTLVEGASRP